ncbi:MAG: short-chain dehydrogenase, partial [Pseudomonadota bacterium]|nr:short-chain dehydrogenase [Pseudomonadota bacterium]
GHGTDSAEVARAAISILSLPAMTGQMIALDGGQHLQWSRGRNVAPPEE